LHFTTCGHRQPANYDKRTQNATVVIMGAIRWGTQGCIPTFQTMGIQYAMSPHIFSLGFPIYWFHTNLSPHILQQICTHGGDCCSYVHGSCLHFNLLLQLPGAVLLIGRGLFTYWGISNYCTLAMVFLLPRIPLCSLRHLNCFCHTIIVMIAFLFLVCWKLVH